MSAPARTVVADARVGQYVVAGPLRGARLVEVWDVPGDPVRWLVLDRRIPGVRGTVAVHDGRVELAATAPAGGPEGDA